MFFLPYRLSCQLVWTHTFTVDHIRVSYNWHFFFFLDKLSCLTSLQFWNIVQIWAQMHYISVKSWFFLGGISWWARDLISTDSGPSKSEPGGGLCYINNTPNSIVSIQNLVVNPRGLKWSSFLHLWIEKVFLLS